MARPQKVGLDYFPLDVDIFEDPKAEKITAQFGLIGDAILVRLLCRIYREGYCTAFDEDAARSIAMKAGERELYATVIEVVEKLLQIGFFDAGLYRKFGILTSRGIQKRYEHICADSGRKISRVPDCHRLLGSESALAEEETIVLGEGIPLENGGEDGETGFPAGNDGLPGYKPVFPARETPQRKEKKTIEFDVDDVRDKARARARGIQPERQAAFGYAPTPVQLEVPERWVREYGGAGMQPNVFASGNAPRGNGGRSEPRRVHRRAARGLAAAALRTLDDVDAAQYRFDRAVGEGHQRAKK